MADQPADDVQFSTHRDNQAKATEVTKLTRTKMAAPLKTTKTIEKISSATTGQSATSGKALDRTSGKDAGTNSRADSDAGTRPCPRSPVKRAKDFWADAEDARGSSGGQKAYLATPLKSVTKGYEHLHAQADRNTRELLLWKKKAEMSTSEATLNADGAKLAEQKASAARDQAEEFKLALDKAQVHQEEDRKAM